MKARGRREFLKVAGATTAAVGLSSRSAHAADWGDIPASISADPAGPQGPGDPPARGAECCSSSFRTIRSAPGHTDTGDRLRDHRPDLERDLSEHPVGRESESPFLFRQRLQRQGGPPGAVPRSHSGAPTSPTACGSSSSATTCSPTRRRSPSPSSGLRLGNPNEASLAAAIAHRYHALGRGRWSSPAVALRVRADRGHRGPQQPARD